MEIKKIERLIKNYSNVNVSIIGDVMLDRFIFGRVSRISPEAPVPVVEIEKEEIRAGGAGNVSLNVKALGGKCILYGIIGNDDDGKLLRNLVNEDKGLVSDLRRPTTLKTRVIAHQQQVVRVDREVTTKISGEIESSLFKKLKENKTDGIIVSDYNKGIITKTLMEKIVNFSKEKDIPIFVDPKVENIELYRDTYLITPNQTEAEEITRIRLKNEGDIEKAAIKIKEELNCKYVVITRGEKGMSVLEDETRFYHLPAKAKEVYDVTGAGDTVISILALSLLSGADIYEASNLANYGAGIVVGKLGTATVTQKELFLSIKNSIRR
ncbi:MAG: D-glycero-beta-D-manno-heptose-7-phosphate kinase [Acidobacteriota bacterium]